MADGFTLPFQEALNFFRQKVSLPSNTWRDLEGRAHDRAFVVAGATSEALLEDIRNAVGDAIAKGKTPRQFQEEFEAIVAKHGWTGWTGEDTPEGRAWRARVIFETNMRTSYAAGRYKQMTDPDLVKVRPYWRYRHAFHRIPLRARREHVLWDNLTLAWDDPWWDSHYPPNGWNCTCGVEPISRRELQKEGKNGPDPTPPIFYDKMKDPLTGEWVDVPQGIALGWGHAPGKSWADGLVPTQLLKPLESSSLVGPKQPTVLPALSEIATPIKAAMLPEGKETAYYAGEFLKAFDTGLGESAKLYRDAAGHALAISDALFRTADGGYKVNKYTRATTLARLAEAIINPDEIWVDWAWDSAQAAMRLVRRYLRFDPKGGGLSIFEWSRAGWSGVTAFPPKIGKSAAAQEDYLTRHRTGALLYRRGKK